MSTFPATTFTDPALERVAEKLDAGLRLDEKDGLALFETPDLLGLGRLADQANRAKNGDKVYYINNLHINYTNICINQCRFCAYSKKDSSREGSFLLSVEQVLEKAHAGWHPRVREFHIVGGCHPDQPFEYYEQMIGSLRREFPEVHIQAFTAVEIANLGRISGYGAKEALERLKDCGLGSLPGGGGEIFAPRVRKKICPEKISGEEYLEVMRQAHQLGINTNCTMLFGHVEEPADRVDHLLKLREVQDESGGFNSFIPLLFHPDNTRFSSLPKKGGIEVLKTIAASRLLLDNFHHIKAFWIMLGLPLTQISLFYGADDVNGTVLEEKITHDAGASTPQHVPGEQLVRLIEQAGRIPVERDTLYNSV